MRAATGLYVESKIKAGMDQVWRPTQEPGFHQRWDLRFTKIKYLPKLSEEDPQCSFTKPGSGLAWLSVEPGRASHLA